MTELLLIADDLTGALDGAVAFVAAGVEVYPLAGAGPSADELRCGARVVAVNAATRHLTPEDASSAVSKLVCAAREAGVRVVFKKTDSALRGNVGAELAAARDVLGGTAHFVPAYPGSAVSPAGASTTWTACPWARAPLGATHSSRFATPPCAT